MILSEVSTLLQRALDLLELVIEGLLGPLGHSLLLGAVLLLHFVLF